MSTPFTDPNVDGFDPFDLDTANQIRIAWGERKEIIQETNDVVPFVVGDDAHEIATWNDMQDWIETTVVNADPDASEWVWIDPTIDPAGDSGFTPITSLAQFRTIAGMNASGFRRVEEWDGESTPIYSFGNAEAGDVFGTWIYEDLINAFSALKWVRHRGVVPTTSTRPHTAGDIVKLTERKYGSTQIATTDCAAARASAVSDFGSASWSNDGLGATDQFSRPQNYGTAVIGFEVTVYGAGFSPSNDLYYHEQRTRTTWESVVQASALGRVVEVYLIPRWFAFSVIDPANTPIYNDLDAKGWTEGEMYLEKAWTEDVAATHTYLYAAYAGAALSDPLDLIPLSCPWTLGVNAGTSQGLSAYSPGMLYKWNCTNEGT